MSANRTLLRIDTEKYTFSEDDLLRLWTTVVDPANVGLQTAIAEEIASYTSEPLPDVLAKMEGGTAALKQLWHDRQPVLGDRKSIENFYRDQFVEAYELAYWHAGCLNDRPPLNYARAALFAVRKGLRRVLDYGSGIGTGALTFAMLGCEVHAADIANELLRFVDHRLRGRGFNVPVYDLNRERPPQGYFDLITCFDVLEHVPDQLEKLREFQAYLRPGGYLFVNFFPDSEDPQRPMHISSASDWLPMVRQTALQPSWEDFSDGVQVLTRRRCGRVRNYIAGWHDRLRRD